MEVEFEVSQEFSEEVAGMDVTEAGVANEDENINTNSIDMLQEHVYNNEDGSVDLAPELDVDENTILLPVAGENGLNADDPAIAEYLQEEEEVTDPMDTNIADEEIEPIIHGTRSNRRVPEKKKTPSQVPKKRRDVAAFKYEPEDEVKAEITPKRRGRKPGSKVINGQVFYPTDDQGITFSKNTPKAPIAKTSPKTTTKPAVKRIKEELIPRPTKDSQCRVCLAVGDLQSIFKAEHTKTYAEKLVSICPSVSIERKDNLPQFICQICTSSINAAYALKTQCEKIDAELRDRLLKATIVKGRRPASHSYVQPESEPEEFIDPPQDQDFKLSDATPPSGDDSDSDFNKPLAKRRTRRRTRKFSKTHDDATNSDRKSKSTSPTKKVVKADNDLNNSKSSELDAEAAAGGDFSSGSEEDYSPPKPKRTARKYKSNENDGFTCRTCNETLPSREELKEHKKTIHSHHECELCGRKFRVLSSYKAHVEKHTQSGELKCEQCEKHFPNKTERRKHMIEVHNETAAQFVCEKCKRAFTSEVRLQKHNAYRCPGFDVTQHKKRADLDTLAMGKDLFKCVAPLTTTYWSDSFSD